MTKIQTELHEEYTAAFLDYLEGAGEAALQRAYELGRRAMDEGLGLLDMAGIHQVMLDKMLDKPGAGTDAITLAKAAAFFAESLSPFEIEHRSFHEAYSALKASEERYRELFENANDIVFTLDLKGHFTSINRAGEVVTGYPRSEAPKMNMAQILAPEYVALYEKIRSAVQAGRGPATYEVEILTKDGRRVPVEVSTRIIHERGTPVGIQGIARDISERRRTEQIFLRMNEALEQQTRRIAHALHDESGQLLASVHIALEEVIADLPARSRKRFQKVKLLLDQIEEQLRQFSHELRPTILDDLGLMPALEFLAQSVSKRTGMAVELDWPKDGRFSPPVEAALYRIAQEALTNVARHARASRVKIRIQPEAGMICCSVKDDGRGFDTVSVLGLKGQRGFGLNGIRMRIEALGGTFLVRSKPGQGTELLFTIPAGK